jgi:hypothetical protein
MPRELALKIYYTLKSNYPLVFKHLVHYKTKAGNKVYLGMKPSQVFKFAEKASNYFGLQVLSKDQSNGVIATQVVGSTNLNRYGSSLVSFEIAAKEENAVITVRSTINGEYDEQKSVQAAKEIVRRIIAYLNGFGGGLNK